MSPLALTWPLDESNAGNPAGMRCVYWDAWRLHLIEWFVRDFGIRN